MIGLDEVERPPSGLSTRVYRELNRELRCAAPGCQKTRQAIGIHCVRCYRVFVTYGSFDRKHLPGGPLLKLRRKALALLESPDNFGHPQIIAGVAGIRRLFGESRVRERPEFEYARRIAEAGAAPKDVIAVTAAVYAYLWRYLPDAYEDGPYAAAQVSRQLLRLAPRKYTRGGEFKSLRRSKALVGAVLDVIGPLVALLVSALERDRRQQESSRRRRSGSPSITKPPKEMTP